MLPVKIWSAACGLLFCTVFKLFGDQQAVNLNAGGIWDQSLISNIRPHPRLFWTTNDEAALNARTQTGLLKDVREEVIAEANQLLTQPPVERVMTGIQINRLALAASRGPANIEFPARFCQHSGIKSTNHHARLIHSLFEG